MGAGSDPHGARPRHARAEALLPLLVQVELTNCFLGNQSCSHIEGTIGPKPIAVPVSLQNGLTFETAVKQSAVILAEGKV